MLGLFTKVNYYVWDLWAPEASPPIPCANGSFSTSIFIDFFFESVYPLIIYIKSRIGAKTTFLPQKKIDRSFGHSFFFPQTRNSWRSSHAAMLAPTSPPADRPRVPERRYPTRVVAVSGMPATVQEAAVKLESK
jgi:hypothetical protein